MRKLNSKFSKKKCVISMPQDIPSKKKPDLNKQQLDMLRLFKKPMSQEDYDEIRRTVVKVLARRVSTEMENLEQERGWNEETYRKWGDEHMRTPDKR